MSSPLTPTGGNKTSSGLDQNLAGALAYLLGPITGILFLVLEKENRFVRFHAMQSTILGVGWIAVSIVLSLVSGALVFIPVVGWIVSILVSFGLGVVGFLCWLLLMWKAFQGEEWEFPGVGGLAKKQLGAGN
jgi:uncharacterized membrane protein